jgi:hypothetical protein
VAAICGWVGDDSGVLIRDLRYGALSIFALISMVRASRREQCDSGQGFLFARPLPPAEIERFLDATPSAVAERTSA